MTDDKNFTLARQSFEKREMQATLVLNSDNFCIIDWRKANGGSNYYVNYIVDRRRGSLIISGDLGDCIATWYIRNSVHNIARYISSIGYFIGKFQCSSDCYDCDDDEVAADIKEQIDTYGDDPLPEEFEEEWDDFKYSIPESIFNDEFHPNDEQCEFLEKYLGPDWWEGSSHWGQTIDIRVYLWVVGFQMAVKQLTDQGLLKEED